MLWFRANRILGSRLALFALAVQFIVAFGHIHRDDIYGFAPTAANELPSNETAAQMAQ